MANFLFRFQFINQWSSLLVNDITRMCMPNPDFAFAMGPNSKNRIAKQNYFKVAQYASERALPDQSPVAADRELIVLRQHVSAEHTIFVSGLCRRLLVVRSLLAKSLVDSAMTENVKPT